MTAMEPLCQLFGISSKKFTKEENLILEAKLFICICEALQGIIKTEYKDCFQLLKFDKNTENTMLENEFLRCAIKDILLTETYSLAGIACYTNTPEDVILEVIAGNNKNPSLSFSRRIIELHHSVRPEIYAAIIKKLTEENSQ